MTDEHRKNYNDSPIPGDIIDGFYTYRINPINSKEIYKITEDINQQNLEITGIVIIKRYSINGYVDYPPKVFYEKIIDIEKFDNKNVKLFIETIELDNDARFVKKIEELSNIVNQFFEDDFITQTTISNICEIMKNLNLEALTAKKPVSMFSFSKSILNNDEIIQLTNDLHNINVIIPYIKIIFEYYNKEMERHKKIIENFKTELENLNKNIPTNSKISDKLDILRKFLFESNKPITKKEYIKTNIDNISELIDSIIEFIKCFSKKNFENINKTITTIIKNKSINFDTYNKIINEYNKLYIINTESKKSKKDEDNMTKILPHIYTIIDIIDLSGSSIQNCLSKKDNTLYCVNELHNELNNNENIEKLKQKIDLINEIMKHIQNNLKNTIKDVNHMFNEIQKTIKNAQILVNETLALMVPNANRNTSKQIIEYFKKLYSKLTKNEIDLLKLYNDLNKKNNELISYSPYSEEIRIWKGGELDGELENMNKTSKIYRKEHINKTKKYYLPLLE